MSRVRRVLNQIEWKSALGELALIVVGILAAFAVDAWWDDRQEAARAVSYLRQLRVDLDANERVIKEFIDHHAAARDSATRLAAYFDAPEPLPGCKTLDELLTATLEWSSLDLRTGTYGALLATGDIRLIRNDELRGEVIHYAGAVNTMNLHLEQDEPQGWVASEVFRRRVTYFWRFFESRPSSEPPIWAGCNFEPFRRDPEFRSGLFTEQLLHSNRVGAAQQLAAANANVQSKLRAELER
jgi:hypothetical protein